MMRGKSHGQALIEFAMVIGVVVVLAIGAIQGLYAFYVTRQVRAATEEIADMAAVFGGDTGDVRAQVPGILVRYRLDANLADVAISPAPVPYLGEIDVSLTYRVSIPFYGLFNLPIPVQKVQRLSEGG
jgi:hypothetical protein